MSHSTEQKDSSIAAMSVREKIVWFGIVPAVAGFVMFVAGEVWNRLPWF